MPDAWMREAWRNASTHAKKWELFRLMTPSQEKELVDVPNRDPLLHPFLESQERVEITMKSGEKVRKVRCYIGRSTGWLPVYLMIKRRDSVSGEPVFKDIVAVRGLGIYRSTAY